MRAWQTLKAPGLEVRQRNWSTSTRTARRRPRSRSKYATASRRRCRSPTSATSTRPQKGFIAAPSFKKIMADAGHVAWDMGSYQWLLHGQDFASIHPSLQRQAVLNMAYGLYEVLPGRIYQVRGFDLANISFIKGDTGWIVFDPLTATETARAALNLINEKLGAAACRRRRLLAFARRPLGGVRGVVDEADVASGKVMLIAPVGFMNHAISENVFAGNAMSRRTQWQYAVLLPAQSARSRRSGDRQERRQRRCRPDRAQSPHQQEHRGNHARRRDDGVPGRVGHRGAGRDEHLLPAVQGAVVVRSHHRHHPQHLHAARRRGAQRAELVQGDQRGAVHVRRRGAR